jgi:hypothetical protein
MVQAYNITGYHTLNSQIPFNPASGTVASPAQVGMPNATVPNRILAFALRFEF